MVNYLYYWCILFIKKCIFKNKIIIFDLPMIGELPYILPILTEYLKYKNICVIIVCRKKPKKLMRELQIYANHIANQILLIKKKKIIFFPSADLFITPEQFSDTLKGIYSISVFHGQPSKGITFNKKVVESFDAFFLFGDLHIDAFNKFIEKNRNNLTRIPEIFKIGYPKTDALLKGTYNRITILNSLRLNPNLKTVLYAPAFNEYATLRTVGKDLIRYLGQIENINIIIKLAPDSIEDSRNFYATGCIKWKEELKEFENERVALVKDIDINPYLVASDVMITDVSGVAYDFLLLDKPVIYFDCPDFYSKYIKKIDPSLTMEECLNDDTINAGRNYGIVVKSFEELKNAIIRSLEYPDELSYKRRKIVPKLLYNPANATEIAINTINKLLSVKAKTQRPCSKSFN